MATPTENLFPRETQMFSQNNPFILDHNATQGNEEVTISPNCSRTRASSTALSLLLKSSVFKQLVEENSDANNKTGGEISEAVSQTEANEYHNFFHGGTPDMLGLFLPTESYNNSIGYQDNNPYSDNSERMTWDGLASVPDLQ